MSSLNKEVVEEEAQAQAQAEGAEAEAALAELKRAEALAVADELNKLDFDFPTNPTEAPREVQYVFVDEDGRLIDVQDVQVETTTLETLDSTTLDTATLEDTSNNNIGVSQEIFENIIIRIIEPYNKLCRIVPRPRPRPCPCPCPRPRPRPWRGPP